MESMCSRWWMVSFLTGDPVAAEYPLPVTLDDVLDNYPNAIFAENLSAPAEPRPVEPEATETVDELTTWPPEPRAWLADGELRTTGVFKDLAAEIVKLTESDLALQRHLLVEHCQTYAPTHFPNLAAAWEERAAIIEFDGGMSREQAEVEAARRSNLLAFLVGLRQRTLIGA